MLQPHQIRRGRCVYHTHQYVTNYCNACHVVLCPTCVCDHNLSHDSCGTRASYQNINQTLSQARQKLLRNVKQFSEERILLDRLNKSTDMIPNKVRQKIEEARRLTWQKISQAFDKLEGQILEYTLSADVRKCTQLIERIDDLMHSVYQDIEVLKTEDYGETLVHFMVQDQHKYQSEKIQIQKFIDSVKLKTLPDIQVSQQSVSDIGALVSKLLLVKYYKSKKQNVQKPTHQYHSNSIMQNPIKTGMTRSNLMPPSASVLDKAMPASSKYPGFGGGDKSSVSGRYSQQKQLDYQAIIEKLKSYQNASSAK